MVVDTSAHALRLCEKGVLVKQFPVALGRSGTGKTKEGDNKTPLGLYAIGTSKPSARFGVFIPLGYPTKEQAAAGLTGQTLGFMDPTDTSGFSGASPFGWTGRPVA